MAAKKKADPSVPVETLSRADKASLLMSSFNKAMRGKGQLELSSRINLPYLTKRIPTGILTLDIALGGGWPAGAISQIMGVRSAGKSYLYWQTIRQLQYLLGDKLCVLLAMTELRADKGQARTCGVKIAMSNDDIADMEKARLSNGLPKFTEDEIRELKTQVGTFVELYADCGETLYDGILQAVESNAFHLIVVDSVGSIITAAEAEADSLTQKHYSGSAKLTTEFLRKLNALLMMNNEHGSSRDVCMLAINQVRDNIGDPHKEFKSTGGRALEHAKFVDLMVASGAKIGDEGVPVYTAKGNQKQWIQTGKEINWRIEKGKGGIHEGAKGMYAFDFATGQVDFYLDALVAAVTYGLVENSGAWLDLKDPANPDISLLRAQGREKFCAELAKDVATKVAEGRTDTFMDLIRKECFLRAGITINYSWANEE